MSKSTKYKIVRYFSNRNKSNRTIQKGLTEEEAQRYCDDPETSSTTCQSAAKKRYTKRNGDWFDGYTEE